MLCACHLWTKLAREWPMEDLKESKTEVNNQILSTTIIKRKKNSFYCGSCPSHLRTKIPKWKFFQGVQIHQFPQTTKEKNLLRTCTKPPLHTESMNLHLFTLINHIINSMTMTCFRATVYIYTKEEVWKHRPPYFYFMHGPNPGSG